MPFIDEVLKEVQRHTDLRILYKENCIKLVGKKINHVAIAVQSDTELNIEFKHINYEIHKDLRHMFITDRRTHYAQPYARPLRVCSDVYEFIHTHDKGSYVPFAIELVEDSAGLPMVTPGPNNEIYLGRIKEVRPPANGYIKVVFSNEATTILKDTKMNLRVGDIVAFTHADNAGVFSWNTVKTVFKLTPSQYQRMKILSQKLILE